MWWLVNKGCTKSMRVFLIGMIMILSSSNLTAQSLSELKAVLSNNSLSRLDSYIISSDSNHLKISSWVFLREIAPDYFEGVAKLYVYIPPKQRDPAGNNYMLYKLSLISHQDSIVYYKIEEQQTIQNSKPSTIVYNPVLLFDKKQMAGLDSSFTKTYHALLDRKELFIDTIAYGNYCGLVTTITPQRSTINRLVKQKNSRALQKWLRSSNTEKQVYAVDGFLQLKKRGFKIGTEIEQLINYIIKKSGTIQTCGGCIQGAEAISEAIKVDE
jgi:hypothetical protein